MISVSYFSEMNSIFLESDVNFNFQTLSIHRSDSGIKCTANCSSTKSCSGVKFSEGQCELFGSIESYSFRVQTVFLKKTSKYLKLVLS